jgi:mRNA-degrading endonuclease toxin of MazEF toxin-antitoxin module
MNVQSGEVVLVNYPYAAGGGAKVQPVLMVQNDRDNQRLLNVTVVQITSMTRRALEPTQLLIEIATANTRVLRSHSQRTANEFSCGYGAAIHTIRPSTIGNLNRE